MSFIHFTLRRSRAKRILENPVTQPFAEKPVLDAAGQGQSTVTKSASQGHETLQTTPTFGIKDSNATTLVDSHSNVSGQATEGNKGNTTVLGKRDLPLTQNAWILAVDQYINQLQPRDKIAVLRWKYTQGLSVEDVDNILAPLKQSYMKGKSYRLIRTAYPFLEHLRSFGIVVDVCMQADPTPGALIWGAVRLVLEVCL
jgi:hypothetical protein